MNRWPYSNSDMLLDLVTTRDSSISCTLSGTSTPSPSMVSTNLALSTLPVGQQVLSADSRLVSYLSMNQSASCSCASPQTRQSPMTAFMMDFTTLRLFWLLLSQQTNYSLLSSITYLASKCACYQDRLKGSPRSTASASPMLMCDSSYCSDSSQAWLPGTEKYSLTCCGVMAWLISRYLSSSPISVTWLCCTFLALQAFSECFLSAFRTRCWSAGLSPSGTYSYLMLLDNALLQPLSCWFLPPSIKNPDYFRLEFWLAYLRTPSCAKLDRLAAKVLGLCLLLLLTTTELDMRSLLTVFSSCLFYSYRPSIFYRCLRCSYSCLLISSYLSAVQLDLM